MNAYDSVKYALDNGRMIFRRPTLIALTNEYTILRAQLAEKDKEIARLTCLLKDNDIPTGDNEFLRGA